MKWIWLACKKTFVFSGRSQRKEYWYFTILYMLAVISWLMIYSMENQPLEYDTWNFGVSVAFLLLISVTSVSVTVRRLHDIDVTGWGIFVNVIPYIGAIGLCVVLAQKGTVGENKYGKDPLNLS